MKSDFFAQRFGRIKKAVTDRLSETKLLPRQKAGLALIVVLGVPAVLYLGGLAGQIIYEHDRWMANGGIASNAKTLYPDVKAGYCFRYAVATGYGHKGILLLLAVAGVIAAYALYRTFRFRRGYDKDRKFRQSESGTYGTSGWMEKAEQEKVFEIASPSIVKGTILGEKKGMAVCLPEDTRLNRHIAVFGAPGVGKSRCFVINQILQSARRGESIIITDSKGELYAATAAYLRKLGYVVRVFDLVNPEFSDSWNCLSEVKGDQVRAQMFVDIIMKNTSEGKSDEFWLNCESNLLKALILFVSLEDGYSADQKTLSTVYDLLITNTDQELENIFNALPNGHPAKFPYQIYLKNKNDKVTGGIAQGIGGRLQVFQAQSIRNITSANEIDLELPAKQKCAYFAILSDQDSTFDFISSLYFSFLFIDLVRYADTIGNMTCDVPVNFVLDEFPNIGQIPDFEKKLATIRSRHMNVDIIFQNLAQLKNRYPNDLWQEIIGCCDTQLFLGCTDGMTAKFISDRAGVIGVEVESQQKELNAIRVTDYTPQFKATSGQGKRNLLNIDEVMRLPNSQALVFLRGEKGLKVNKFDYSRHPDSKLLCPCNVKEHIPEWRAKIEAARKKNTAPAVVPVSAPKPSGTQPGGSQLNGPKPNGSQQTSGSGNGKGAPGSPTSENSEKQQSALSAGNPHSEKSENPSAAPNADSGNKKRNGKPGLIKNSVKMNFVEKYPHDI